MANYDEATRAKVQAQFQAIDPMQASGGAVTRLQGQKSQITPVKPADPGFWGELGHEAKGLAEATPGLLAKIGKAVFVEPFTKTAHGIASALTGNQRLDAANRQADIIADTQITYAKKLRSGQINQEEYDRLTADLLKDRQSISKQIDDVNGETNSAAARDFVINAYASVLTPLTMASGLGVAGASGRLATTAAVEEGTGLATNLGKYVPRIAEYVGRADQSLEALASKIPTLANYLKTTPEANTLGKTAINALLKNPIKMNLAVRDPIGVMFDAANKKYGSAAFGAAMIGLMPFEGGPLGVIQKLGGKISDGIKLRAFGKTGFIDEMSKYLKGDAFEYVNGLKTTNPEKYKEALQAWKTFESFNGSHFDGDVKAMVENIAEWHAKHSNPIGEYTPEQLTDYWIDFKNSLGKVQQLAKDGRLEINGAKIGADEASRVGIGKFGTEEKYALIKELNKMPDKDARIAVVDAMISEGYGWAQNPNMRKAMQAAVQDDDFTKSILKIRTGNAVKILGDGAEEFPRNYFPIYLNKNAKGYDTEVLENIGKINTTTEIGDVLDRSIAPKGIAGSAANFMTNLGLSPKDTNAQSFLALRRNIASNLLEGGIKIDADLKGTATDADYIMSKLGEFADKQKSVFDLRQLRTSEIQEALGVSTAEAKTIKKALFNAYTEIPLQVRGLGDKIVDFNMSKNPFAAPYSRAQAKFRYTANPFFAAQEILETEGFSQALSGGKRLQLPGVNTLTNIFRKDRPYLDEVVQKLEQKGLFMGAAGRGEFAADSVSGGISAKLRNAQKVSIAGFIDKLASKQGMTVDQYLAEHGQEAADLAREVVQYPKKGGLNSPLAKFLSLAVFPARYNVKVAGLAAKALAKQSPLNQVLVLNSLMDMGDWLKSDEGIAWQSKNSEALGIIKYFTPINTFSQVAKVLTGHADSASDYGALGGLPFGVISSILEHQGVTNMNAPYMNPRTGEVLPDYIPKTAKARAKSAIDDLLASVFSYPGRIVGGPSKSEVVDTFTSKLPGMNVSRYDANEFDKVDRSADLSAAQLHRQSIIKQANGITSTPSPVANPFQDFNIPSPQALKPLVTRSPKQSIDKATAGKRISTTASNKRAKKQIFARPPQ